VASHIGGIGSEVVEQPKGGSLLIGAMDVNAAKLAAKRQSQERKLHKPRTAKDELVEAVSQQVPNKEQVSAVVTSAGTAVLSATEAALTSAEDALNVVSKAAASAAKSKARIPSSSSGYAGRGGEEVFEREPLVDEEAATANPISNASDVRTFDRVPLLTDDHMSPCNSPVKRETVPTTIIRRQSKEKDEWQLVQREGVNPFWYNRRTKVSQWEPPDHVAKLVDQQKND